MEVRERNFLGAVELPLLIMTSLNDMPSSRLLHERAARPWDPEQKGTEMVTLGSG